MISMIVTDLLVQDGKWTELERLKRLHPFFKMPLNSISFLLSFRGWLVSVSADMHWIFISYRMSGMWIRVLDRPCKKWIRIRPKMEKYPIFKNLSPPMLVILVNFEFPMKLPDCFHLDSYPEGQNYMDPTKSGLGST